MDAFITITVVSEEASGADQAIEKAFNEIERLEKLASFYSPNSEISLINLHAGKAPVKVSPDILELLVKAQDVAAKTDGAFDVTIGPVISLYDFRRKARPHASEIAKKLSLVDYRQMMINKTQSTVLLKKKGMLIDAGGILKGYAAEKAVNVLKYNGIAAGIVAIAGDIRVFGLKPDGAPWKVGIRDPRGKHDDDTYAAIDLSDSSISTSGDYERFFMLDGKRVHHLISPKTGFPAEGCQSVSIISPDGALADAYSTGIFILGPEKGLKVFEQTGLEGVIIDSNGTLYATPGIRGHLELKKPS